MDFIQANLQGICARIAAARAAAGSAVQPVCLIAVSKTQPAASVVQAAQAGQRDFGENYIQEGVDKIRAVQAIQRAQALQPMHPQQAITPQQTPKGGGCTPLIWHMIGPIQSNKTRLVAEHFDWVHTVDRLKIAQRLSEQRPAPLAPLQVLIQVNVDDEASKSGVSVADAAALAQAVAALPRLKLRGLMCIPEKSSVLGFQVLAALLAKLNQLPTFAAQNALDVLSMGMSADFELAIAQGASHVRVGSAIFGARP